MIGEFKFRHWLGFVGACFLLASPGAWFFGEGFAKASAAFGLLLLWLAAMLTPSECGVLPHASETPEKRSVEE